MDIKEFSQEWLGFWRRVVGDFARDVKRLWLASRVTGASAVILGALYGLLPIGACISLFRLVDAVTGARGVRVRTSDFSNALWLMAGLWVGAMIVVYAYDRLRGVVHSVAWRSAILACVLAAFFPLLVLAPWRTMLWAALVKLCAPWMQTPRGQMLFIAANIAGGLLVAERLMAFLLSRSLSVGAFLLFFLLTVVMLTASVCYALAEKPPA